MPAHDTKLTPHLTNARERPRVFARMRASQPDRQYLHNKCNTKKGK